MEGFISGFVGTLITHPLEVLKVKRQVNVKGNSQLFRGILLNPSVYGLHYLIYFNIYPKLKKHFDPYTSAFISQGVSSLILNPLWVIRTKRMAMGQDYSVILRELFPPGKLINKEYLYRGLGYSSLICFQTGTAFSIVEYLHEHNSITNTISQGIQNTFGEKFNEVVGINDNTIIIDSFIAKTVSGIIFYPLDTIRNIIRTNGDVTFSLKLYNGLGYYLLRSVPAFVIVNYIHSELIKFK
jgi:hypothetical protein